MVLHLWATWCGPCITELPALAALIPSFDAQGITLLPVALDHGGAAKVAPFLSRLHLSDFSTFYDPRAAILAALEEESLPLTLLVDRNGEEIARHAGPISWQAPGAISTVTRLFR